MSQQTELSVNPDRPHFEFDPGLVGQVRAPHGVTAAIITLGLGGLFLGTGEFASMSLLPDLAKGTGVSVPTAGTYISAYALGVVVGAPLLAVTTARLPRKRLLMLLLALFAVGYAASGLAWNFVSLNIARFIAGLPHGGYYGVASIVAASLVAENKRAQAIGYVMLGLAAANVIGVPIVTWLGQSMGWRAAFISMAAGGVVTIFLTGIFIPVIAANKEASPLAELAAFRKKQVWLTLGVASIGFGGMFSVYSYITPTLTQVTGLAASGVPLALALWGVGMVFGNLVGGWLSDRALIPSIVGMLIWNIIFLGLFSLVAQWQVATMVTLFLIGNGFALVPALQTRLMQVSGDAQTLAASLNHSAFNLSNAIGAASGAASISAGYGWASTGWVGATLACGGLIMMGLSIWQQRKVNL